MCGIVGVISEKSLNDVSIESLTNVLRHRGPDDYGIYSDDYAALGHRRLSIIDLAGGQQPIFNEDRSKCIIFNGEIYNFNELRDELLNKGHCFSTQSDTETILHAYEEWDKNCVDRLRGMFAFAIWDSDKKRLFIARDRLGIKPLFYAEYMGKFYFASEMKAILADSSIPRDIDDVALASYFTLSYIPAHLTIYSNIRKLLPGHMLFWQNGKVKIQKYWDVHFCSDRTKGEKYFIDGFLEHFQKAVSMRLMSDVPLGAFLSGGIDSSAVAASMSMVSSQPVNTFCMGFGGHIGGYLDERKYAQLVSDRYSTNHKDYEIVPRFDGLLEKIVRSFDEPFADDSTIPSYFVCKLARENVTVALSGLGGDELFAGYERYLGFQLSRLYEKLPHFLRERVIRKIIEKLPERADGHYTINHMKRFVRSGSLPADQRYFGYTLISCDGWDLFSEPERFRQAGESCQSIILSYFNASNADDDLNRVFYCDLKTYVPDDILVVIDRMSMHHALEVRVPFLDHKLVEFCATIPPEMKLKGFQKKYLLKRALQDMLPSEVINHRKQGFVGPMTIWLKTDLKSYVLEHLSQVNLAKHGLFNEKVTTRLIHEHFSGKEIHDTLIWSLIVFQAWFDLYIEQGTS
jgi:asparagine synthase (glutamine-hydrolysing)